MLRIKTYKFRLYPTRKQTRSLDRTLEVCRILYNSCLLDRKNSYEKTGKGLSMIRQQEILKADKYKIESLSDIHSQVLQDVLFRVDRAFQAFFRRIKEGNGKAGYPRYKGEGRYDSITYPQEPGFQITPQGLNLSKIGHIKIKLHSPVMGSIKTCIIKREIDRWYACFSVELPDVEKRPVESGTGIDASFRKVVTLSNGESIENPSFYRTTLDKLKTAQQSLSRKAMGSGNRKKQRIVVVKLHRKIAAKRRDFLHKLSRALVNTYDFIVVEKLDLNNMVQSNRYIRKPLYDTAWGYLKQMLSYKAEDAGKRVVEVEPGGTSERCSNYGAMVPKPLSKSTHKCPACGLVMDRDLNAAINILRLGTSLCGGIDLCPEGQPLG